MSQEVSYVVTVRFARLHDIEGDAALRCLPITIFRDQYVFTRFRLSFIFNVFRSYHPYCWRRPGAPEAAVRPAEKWCMKLLPLAVRRVFVTSAVKSESCRDSL